MPETRITNSIRAQKHETPLLRVAFRVPALVTGLPAIVAGGYLHLARTGYLGRSASSLEAALAGCLLFCGLAGYSPAAGTSLAPF